MDPSQQNQSENQAQKNQGGDSPHPLQGDLGGGTRDPVGEIYEKESLAVKT